MATTSEILVVDYGNGLRYETRFDDLAVSDRYSRSVADKIARGQTSGVERWVNGRMFWWMATHPTVEGDATVIRLGRIS